MFSWAGCTLHKGSWTRWQVGTRIQLAQVLSQFEDSCASDFFSPLGSCRAQASLSTTLSPRVTPGHNKEAQVCAGPYLCLGHGCPVVLSLQVGLAESLVSAALPSLPVQGPGLERQAGKVGLTPFLQETALGASSMN